MNNNVLGLEFEVGIHFVREQQEKGKMSNYKFLDYLTLDHADVV